MLILRNIIITILLLVLAAITIVGIMIETPTIWNWTPDRINAMGLSVLSIMRPGLFLYMIWWVILLSILLVFLLTVARPRKRMKIEVQMGGGRVVIMDAAIKKYIRNALAELGEVTVKKIDLREHRNLVTTDITADVRTRENLPILERRIISRVRAALAEDLGITNLGDVHVFIRNFEVTGRPVQSSPSSAEKLEKTRATGQEERIVSREHSESEAPATPPKTAAAAAIAGSAATDHALTEPVEPAGAAEPIVIKDSDEADSESTPSRFSSFEMARPGSTTSSDSENIILAEKSLPGQDDSPGVSLDNEDKTAMDADHEDLDHPAPWTTNPDDRDDEDKGPLPL